MFSLLWLLRLYSIFPHYLINGTILEKCYETQNVCFDLLYKFVRNISHSRKNGARYDHKCMLVFM
jgi:hypothetical protein